MKFKKGLIRRYVEEEDVHIYFTEEMLNNNVVICEATDCYEGENGIETETMISVKHYSDLDAWEFQVYWGEVLAPIQILRIVKDVYELYNEYDLDEFLDIMYEFSVSCYSASMQSELLNRVKTIKEIRDFFELIKNYVSE